jgi:hypothetical protein
MPHTPDLTITLRSEKRALQIEHRNNLISSDLPYILLTVRVLLFLTPYIEQPVFWQQK